MYFLREFQVKGVNGIWDATFATIRSEQLINSSANRRMNGRSYDRTEINADYTRTGRFANRTNEQLVTELSRALYTVQERNVAATCLTLNSAIQLPTVKIYIDWCEDGGTLLLKV